MASIERHFRTLGLTPAAGLAEVTAAFRRLAKQYHPDVARPGDDPHRFVAILQSYAVLREYLPARFDRRGDALCPQCRRRLPVLRDPAGRSGCADCLLGETRRRRFLPLPARTVARHAAVFMTYLAAVMCLVLYLRDGQKAYVAASFVCATSGLLLLAVEVLRLAGRNAAGAQH